MYGTIAVLRSKPGVEKELIALIAGGAAADTPGVVARFIYRMENEPDTYYAVVIFASKDAYFANANNPTQHERFTRVMTLLQSEPEWHDGELVFP